MRDIVAETILDGSEEAFCVLDAEGRFVYTNERAEQLLRRSGDQLSGRRAWDEFSGAVGESIERAHQHALQEREPVICDAYFPDLDAWFQFRAYPKDALLIVHFRDVTRRRRAYAELRESEERFRRMFERSTMPKLLVAREDLRILEANAAAVALYGHPRDELLSMTLRDLSGPDFLQAMETALAELPDREIHRTRFRHLVAGGEIREVEMTIQELPSDGGAIYLITLDDVSVQSRTEAALRDNEARFQLVAAFTSDVIWDYDFERDQLWWSHTTERLFGHPSPGTSSSWDSMLEHIHPADRSRLQNYLQESTRAHLTSGWLEHRCLRADGTTIHVLNRMKFLYDEVGRPVRAVGVLVDITRQKRAEERQRFLFETGLLLTSTRDYDERLHVLARACAGRLAHYCLLEVQEDDGRIRRIGATRTRIRSATTATTPSAAGELLREWSANAEPGRRTGGIGTFPLVVKQARLKGRRDREPRRRLVLRSAAIRSVVSQPLRTTDERVGTLTLININGRRPFSRDDREVARDVARQAAIDIVNARQYQRTVESRRVAEAASQLKGQFLTMMSHELRTPLNAILIIADLIESEVTGPVSRLQKEHVSRIKSSAWHLVAMIEEVLAYSRIEAGAEQLHRSHVDLSELGRGVAHLLAPKAAAKGLTFTVRVPERVMHFETDAGKLRQILINLIGNAIKFTDHGEVTFVMRRRGECVEFSVRDTGEGVSDEDRERIFEPFVQMHAAARRREGAGLGLAISRQFARMLGGDIEVESRPGAGSTFTLRLPSRG